MAQPPWPDLPRLTCPLFRLDMLALTCRGPDLSTIKSWLVRKARHGESHWACCRRDLVSHISEPDHDNVSRVRCYIGLKVVEFQFVLREGPAVVALESMLNVRQEATND